MWGREPILIATAIATALSGVGIFWFNDLSFSVASMIPILASMIPLFARGSVASKNTVEQATGKSLDELKVAADANELPPLPIR